MTDGWLITFYLIHSLLFFLIFNFLKFGFDFIRCIADVNSYLWLPQIILLFDFHADKFIFELHEWVRHVGARAIGGVFDGCFDFLGKLIRGFSFLGGN